MDKPKLSNLLTTEDLLKSLEEQEDKTTVIDEYDADISDFIAAYNLKPGSDFVSSKVLHELHKLSSKEEINIYLFVRYVSVYLPKVTSGFEINLAESKITKELIEKIKPRKNQKRYWKPNLSDFIREFAIGPGKNKVLTDVLFMFYRYWSKEKDRSRFSSKDKFTQHFKLHVNLFVVKNNKKYHKINKTLEELAGRELASMIERQYESESKKEKGTKEVSKKKKEDIKQESEEQVSLSTARVELKD